MKRIIISETAKDDFRNIVCRYRGISGDLSCRFRDAMIDVFGMLGFHPGAGSLRYAFELGIPGVRVWKLKEFPYIVFYLERENFVEILRILHASRQIDEASLLVGDRGSFVNEPHSPEYGAV